MIRSVINFVVSSLEVFAVAGFFLSILTSVVVGATGAGFIGAVAGLLGGIIWSVVVFGILFLMIQNNKILKEIRDGIKTRP